MPKKPDDPEAVEAYLTGLAADERSTLQALRKLIHSIEPGLRERISYGTTAIFATERGDLVGFVSQPKHLSFFTMSPQLAKEMSPEIKKTHKVSGATIHFSPSEPLPKPLVKKIVKARLKEQASG